MKQRADRSATKGARRITEPPSNEPACAATRGKADGIHPD
jgi:hypothetical protein